MQTVLYKVDIALHYSLVHNNEKVVILPYNNNNVNSEKVSQNTILITKFFLEKLCNVHF